MHQAKEQILKMLTRVKFFVPLRALTVWLTNRDHMIDLLPLVFGTAAGQSHCGAENTLAFVTANVWEGSLPLQHCWKNEKHKYEKINLRQGQWMKVNYLCSAWNYVSSGTAAVTQAWNCSSEKWRVSAIFMDMKELKAKLWLNYTIPSTETARVSERSYAK